MQDDRIRVPQRPLQTSGRFGDQHFHVIRRDHQSRPHLVCLGGVGGGQLAGSEAAGDPGASAAMSAGDAGLAHPAPASGEGGINRVVGIMTVSLHHLHSQSPSSVAFPSPLLPPRFRCTCEPSLGWRYRRKQEEVGNFLAWRAGGQALGGE